MRPMRVTKDFIAVKAGDRVWLSNHNATLLTVARVTDCQIVCGEGPHPMRFARHNGRPIGSGSYWIRSVATKGEIVKYEARQAKERAESKRRGDRLAKVEEQRRELYGLFVPTVWADCQIEHSYADGKWAVTIGNLSTEGVKALASLLKTGLDSRSDGKRG